MNTGPMIDALAAQVSLQRERASEIALFPPEQLLKRPSPVAWNTLEILEHLNLSSGIYMRGLQKAFDQTDARYAPNPVFAPGWLGNWFTNSLEPGPSGTIHWKMRTIKLFDPARQQGASRESINRFLSLCDQLLALLDRARGTDLNKIRVPSSLGPMVRFKAGDALRFPVAHQARHFLQIEKALRT